MASNTENVSIWWRHHVLIGTISIGKKHQRGSFEWSSIWHITNSGLSVTQQGQIPVMMDVWQFYLTCSVCSMAFCGFVINLHLIYCNWPVSSGWCINSSLPGQNGRHFGRRQFQMHFLEWTWYNSDSNFTEIYFQEFNRQQASIGSVNCLAPNRRQATTWTNADPVHWRAYMQQWWEMNSCGLWLYFCEDWSKASFNDMPGLILGFWACVRPMRDVVTK